MVKIEKIIKYIINNFTNDYRPRIEIYCIRLNISKFKGDRFKKNPEHLTNMVTLKGRTTTKPHKVWLNIDHAQHLIKHYSPDRSIPFQDDNNPIIYIRMGFHPFSSVPEIGRINVKVH